MEIQQKLTDSRDNRGKRHKLPFVVVLFLTSILRTDKLLKMSVIHRAMQDSWRELAEQLDLLAEQLDLKVKKCVSYSQLKRIIRGIDIESFNAINARRFKFEMQQMGLKI